MNKIALTLMIAFLSGITASAQIHKMERRDSIDRTYNLNPVVVTGSGHHQRLKSTSTPVSVISSQEIREQGIKTFDGALTRLMPQVSMAPNSMGSQLRLN
jgi:outer membrane receptor for ferrienterochelin and colicins